MDIPHWIWTVSAWYQGMLTRYTRERTYSVYKVFPPIAQVQKNRPTGSNERIGHGFEPVERDLGRPDSTHVITTVVLEKVNPPRCKALRILYLMVERSLL